MKKIFVRMIQVLLVILVLLVIGTFTYLQHARFGDKSSGARLERMQNAPTYKDGAFHNVENTPMTPEGVSTLEMLQGFFFDKDKRNVPKDTIPVKQTDLKSLPLDSNLYVWFGHSSYYLQLDGKRILVDPVFSKYATPVRVSVRAFDYQYEYTAEDMPEIDIMVITHDHWDHLDYNTFKKLQHKVKHIVTGLGVGSHLERWDFPAADITELYWGETASVNGLQFTSTVARHFSGRTFKRNASLWSSFVLKGSQNIFLGGDSGYGKHFKEIGSKYGPFDFAILENGQYNQMWKYIHMMPEEVVLVADELQARYTIPVHSSKFPLANHAWDDPLIRVTKAAEEKSVHIITPMVGQVVSLQDVPTNTEWWKGIR